METINIEQKIQALVAHLGLEEKLRVYEFAEQLAQTQVRGIPGNDLLRFAGTVPAAELALMEKAIEADCEKINPDEW